MTLSFEKNIKVCAISTSCLDYYNQKNKDIDLIRVKVFMDNKEYVDGENISSFDFYQLLKKNSKLSVRTSQPSLGELINYFKNLYEKGYKKVFIPTVSKTFSGTYNAIVQAKKMINKVIEVIPYDTNTISFSEGYFSIIAQNLFSQGYSVEQVIQNLDFLKKNNTIFFVVNSLNQLVKSGRLTSTKGFLGRLFRIKPILQINDKGCINIIEKKMKLDSAFCFIIDKIKNYIEDLEDDNFLIYLLFTRYENKLKSKFKFMIINEFKIKNILEIPVSPSIGAHVGEDVIGVGIIRKINNFLIIK
ncbi:DegV family protein [Candidatus Phytoplasma sacchari]|nr:DegV family protein [Candidatus Phytoplasma sacchari]KAB8122723.1 DegV family protein [Candidatus Phytoplasma sacchari]